MELLRYCDIINIAALNSKGVCKCSKIKRLTMHDVCNARVFLIFVPTKLF